MSVTCVLALNPRRTLTQYTRTIWTQAQAVELHRKHRPDITLMDMRMPGMSGLEAAMAIRTEVLRRASSRSAPTAAMKTSGARCMRVRSICRHRSEPRWMLAHFPADLSAREMEVLSHIVKGEGNKQIAYALGIAEQRITSRTYWVSLVWTTESKPPRRLFSGASSTCKS